MATRNPRKPSSVKLTPTYGYHFVAKTYTPTGALSKATTAADDLFARDTYRVGDGEVPTIRRPGSDHSHIKSRGNLC